jgi:hypothetical protein
MTSFVPLFDFECGDFFAEFASEEEAWDELRQWAEESGLEDLHGLGLMQTQDEKPTLIAMEDELVQRVRAMIQDPSKR